MLDILINVHLLFILRLLFQHSIWSEISYIEGLEKSYNINNTKKLGRQVLYFTVGLMDGVWMNVVDGGGKREMVEVKLEMVGCEGDLAVLLLGRTCMKYELVFSGVRQCPVSNSHVLFWSCFSRWHVIYGSVISMTD